jgi:hypothetical protein
MKVPLMLKVSLKVKVLGKHLGVWVVPHPIGHPMYLIWAAREAQGGVELHDDLIILWITKGHDVIDLVVLIGYDDLIEKRVVLVPHVNPVDALHWNHHGLLGLGHWAVPIHVKVGPESGSLLRLGI